MSEENIKRGQMLKELSSDVQPGANEEFDITDESGGAPTASAPTIHKTISSSVIISIITMSFETYLK